MGNSAVQEAHAGMSFYHCHAAAVITNPTFTKGARELAASVRCILIDGSQIPDLIRGKIRLSADDVCCLRARCSSSISADVPRGFSCGRYDHISHCQADLQSGLAKRVNAITIDHPLVGPDTVQDSHPIVRAAVHHQRVAVTGELQQL